MKEIKSIIESQSDLNLILESELEYKDTLPTEASEILESELEYKDTLPAEVSEIDSGNSKYIIMKYYEGTIKKEEHSEFKKSANSRDFLPVRVYDYIFQIQENPENWMDTIDTKDLKEEIINEIADLWIMKPEEFNYKEEFEKLIFVCYCEKKDMRFKTIAMRIYENNENGWAGDYIGKYAERKNLFLQKRKIDKDYQKEYGIEEIGDSEAGKAASNTTRAESEKEGTD